jgi:hypothetical protein
MNGPSNALRLVLSRHPVPFRAARNYWLCYVVETLECGHKVTVHPQADPLTAKRRNCPDCGKGKKARKAA